MDLIVHIHATGICGVVSTCCLLGFGSSSGTVRNGYQQSRSSLRTIEGSLVATKRLTGGLEKGLTTIAAWRQSGYRRIRISLRAGPRGFWGLRQAITRRAGVGQQRDYLRS